MRLVGSAAGEWCLHASPEAGSSAARSAHESPFIQLSVDRLRHPPTASLKGRGGHRCPAHFVPICQRCQEARDTIWSQPGERPSIARSTQGTAGKRC